MVMLTFLQLSVKELLSECIVVGEYEVAEVKLIMSKLKKYTLYVKLFWLNEYLHGWD